MAFRDILSHSENQIKRTKRIWERLLISVILGSVQRYHWPIKDKEINYNNFNTLSGFKILYT
jgi:hypothetical protein